MKYNLPAILLGIVLFAPAVACAGGSYPGFETHAVLGQDGVLSVRERFVSDFGITPMHGVVREIPLITASSQRTPFQLQFLTAQDEHGAPYETEVAQGGNVAQVRVGSNERTLTGAHLYDVSYRLLYGATDESVTWSALAPMQENVAKFRGELYLPRSVALGHVTASCAFAGLPTNATCATTSIINDGKLIGFRVDLNDVSGKGVLVSVRYPRGLVAPLVAPHDVSRQIPIWVFWLLAFASLVIILGLLAARYRTKLVEWRQRRRRPVVFPDAYSYLARAQARDDGIAHDDVVATLADLVARGYLSLSPIASPVGELETVDYAISVITRDALSGAEAELVRQLDDAGGIDSLDRWLREEFPKVRSSIAGAASVEVDSVILLESDENPPRLPGFRFRN